MNDANEKYALDEDRAQCIAETSEAMKDEAIAEELAYVYTVDGGLMDILHDAIDTNDDWQDSFGALMVKKDYVQAAKQILPQIIAAALEVAERNVEDRS